MNNKQHKVVPDCKVEEEHYILNVNKIEKVIIDFTIEKTVEQEINKVIDLVIWK